MLKSLTAALLGIALLTSVYSAPIKAKKDSHGLPQKLQQTVTAIVEAAEAGDPKAVWEHLHSTATKLKKEARAPFEKALSDSGLPNMMSLLLRARLGAQSLRLKIPEPDLRERVILCRAVSEEIEAAFKFSAANRILQGKAPRPRTMNEYEAMFRELESVHGRITEANVLARYGLALRKKIDSAALRRLTAEDREAIEPIDDDVLADVELAAQTVTEVGLELRLDRLEFGIEALRKSELTEDRFKAAYSTQVDGQVLLDEVANRNPGVKSPSPPFVRDRMKALELSELKAQIKLAADLAGPLAEKTNNLFIGLQWWLRGRYGSGMDLGGLAKPAQALSNPQLLMFVAMPAQLPEPGSSTAQPRQVPDHVDRRHHYTWAWEDRTIARSFAGMKTRVTMGIGNVVGSWVNLSEPQPPVDVLQKDMEMKTVTVERVAVLPAQDPRLVYRIVGFLEYGKSLELLNLFVERATIAELELADKIVRDQEPFALETNLSRAVEQPSLFTEKSANPRDDFVRRGLAWVLALARVEIGAMLAGFTSHENPFLSLSPATFAAERVRSQPYGTAEFREVLLDATRTHYWALRRDPAVNSYYKIGIPEQHLVTYARRALLGSQFIRACTALFPNTGTSVGIMSPQATLKAWDEAFQKIQRMTLYCLTFKVGHDKTTEYDWTINEVIGVGPVGPIKRKLLDDHHVDSNADPAPEQIRNLLLTVDPSLTACPCR